MKRGWRLCALVAALGIVSWASPAPQAEAVDACDVYEGQACSPAGDSLNCFWLSRVRGYCFCEPVAGQPGYYWVCGEGKP